MGESNLYNGSAMRLEEGLEARSADGCALISCPSGELAVHLPEAPAAPLILHRDRVERRISAPGTAPVQRGRNVSAKRQISTVFA